MNTDLVFQNRLTKVILLKVSNHDRWINFHLVPYRTPYLEQFLHDTMLFFSLFFFFIYCFFVLLIFWEKNLRNITINDELWTFELETFHWHSEIQGFLTFFFTIADHQQIVQMCSHAPFTRLWKSSSQFY